MNIRITRWLLALVGLTLFITQWAAAQNSGGNRNVFSSTQQNSRSPFQSSAVASPFGAVGQGLQTPRLGSSPTGAFGQSGNQGGLLGNFGQPPVGGQDGFVGSDAQQIRSNRDPRQSRRAMFDFAIDSLNEMRESRRQERSRQNEKPPVRVQIRPLFTVAPPSASELTMRIRTRVGSALPAAIAATTRISVRSSTALIEGTVSTEYDRQLANKIISLQPGISQIEDQLAIDPPQRD